MPTYNEKFAALLNELKDASDQLNEAWENHWTNGFNDAADTTIRNADNRHTMAKVGLMNFKTHVLSIRLRGGEIDPNSDYPG